MAQVIVFCGGKCGGTTLANTFHKNGYMSHHFHDIKCKGLFGTTIETDNIFDFIDENSKDNNVYIIDVYRTPIERSISSFFQNIDIHLPNYKNLTIEDIIKFYNDNKLYLIEDYHPINTMLKKYNILPFDNFNFETKYNIIRENNKIFIKLLFKDINNWDKILSEIFENSITMYNANLTENKNTYKLYKLFNEKYKIPKEYITRFLTNNIEFKIYNTYKEQQEYITKWLNKSF